MDGDWVYGATSSAADNDYFTFDTTTGSKYTVILDWTSDLHGYYYILDPDESYMAWGYSPAKTFTATSESHTLWIKYNGVLLDYGLRIIETVEDGNTGFDDAAALTIDDVSVSHNISSRSDFDFFEFDDTYGTRYTVTAESADTTPMTVRHLKSGWYTCDQEILGERVFITGTGDSASGPFYTDSYIQVSRETAGDYDIKIETVYSDGNRIPSEAETLNSRQRVPRADFEYSQ